MTRIAMEDQRKKQHLPGAFVMERNKKFHILMLMVDGERERVRGRKVIRHCFWLGYVPAREMLSCFPIQYNVCAPKTPHFPLTCVVYRTKPLLLYGVSAL
jgi:hypothetical protein